MNIQLINFSNDFSSGGIFTCNSLGHPDSFDRFDVNIIDLNNGIWVSKGSNNYPVDVVEDLDTIKHLVENSSSSITIGVLPMNHIWKWHLLSGGYFDKAQLKDKIKYMIKAVTDTIPIPFSYDCYYGTNVTSLDNIDYYSDFAFVEPLPVKTMTKANDSQDVTTIQADNRIYLTTLDITKDENSIINFLKSLSLIDDEKEELPEWLKQIEFFDDKDLNHNLSEKQKKLQELEKDIEGINDKLSENLKYKSILFTNGNELHEIVLKILSIVFDYDYSDYIDEKKEDFRIHLEDVTLIGEVKGISTNVKKANVSQVFQHMQEYSDTLDEQGLTENIKGILIINHQRYQPLDKREAVPSEQIAMAERNEILIIETTTLLRIFEKVLQGYPKSIILDALKNKSGLLGISDLTS